jgi:hypothetical protein
MNEAILIVGQVKRCLEDRFQHYEYKRKSGFQLRTFTKDGKVAVRVIYRITGRAETAYTGKEKRNAKLRNLREFTEHLMTHGFALSEEFPSNGKASYVIEQPQLRRARLESFDGLQMNSLLLADGQDENDLKSLYLVTQYWYGKEHPEVRIRSMRYGTELIDSYNSQELATYGYKVIGLLSEEMVKRMEEWWSKPDQVFYSLNSILHPSTKITYAKWRLNNKVKRTLCFYDKKNARQWKESK